MQSYSWQTVLYVLTLWAAMMKSIPCSAAYFSSFFMRMLVDIPMAQTSNTFIVAILLA